MGNQRKLSFRVVVTSNRKFCQVQNSFFIAMELFFFGKFLAVFCSVDNVFH